VVYGEKYRIDDGLRLLERANVKTEFIDAGEPQASAKP
jgi:hypothetical protein